MGKIILLNTPIGNLGDLTPRVLEGLKEGKLFAAEDTRVFKELLNHLGISIQGKKVFSLHEHSGGEQINKLLDQLKHDDLFITSDAGSPIISDPAWPLVVAAINEGVAIESRSGVSSPIMALELSGLPPIPFHFFGFLPREKSKKLKLFETLPQGTSIFFEAPNRVEETMEILANAQPNLAVALVRELSKKFEQVMRLRASEWSEKKDELTIKGEFVLLVHSENVHEVRGGELREIAQEILAKGAGAKLVSKLLGEILDRPTKEIYSLLTKQKDLL